MEGPSPLLAADREGALARTFVRFADALVDDYDVVLLLQDLVDSCVQLLDVDAAGVLLRNGGKLEVGAASAVAARDIEIFQAQAEEGPCHDCLTTGEALTVEDLEADGRWPRFTQVARRRGINAVHALPLRLRGEVLGALNLFHKQAYPWPEGDKAVARALADVATIGIIQYRAATDARVLGEQLQQALDSRVLIEQTKGVLAQQGGVALDAAFQIVRTYARNRNRPLRSVCQQIIAGELVYHDLL